MDNFYCDPHLFIELEQKQILACGTIRSNRKRFPKDIVLNKAVKKTIAWWDYVWRCHNSFVTMAWYDKRTVYLISTIYPPESTGEPSAVQCHSAMFHVLQSRVLTMISWEVLTCPKRQQAFLGFTMYNLYSYHNCFIRKHRHSSH